MYWLKLVFMWIFTKLRLAWESLSDKGREVMVSMRRRCRNTNGIVGYGWAWCV